jgi:hypothetical protein
VRQSGSNGQVVEAIGFGLGSFLELFDQPNPPLVDLAFIPERNTWNGRDSLQLRVKDLHPVDAS